MPKPVAKILFCVGFLILTILPAASDQVTEKAPHFQPPIYTLGAKLGYVRAIDDTNPLWDTVAPPAFIVTVGGEEFGRHVMAMFLDGLLHGATELECYQPVKPGDEIKVTCKITGIRERSTMAFATFDITYTNQKQEMVARCQQTLIGYDTEGKKNG